MNYFAVTRRRGSRWNRSVSMRKQRLWNEHAAFMDGLADEGFVILGGPVGGGMKTFLFLVKADSKKTIENRLAADPWSKERMLRISNIEPWELLLGKPDQVRRDRNRSV